MHPVCFHLTSAPEVKRNSARIKLLPRLSLTGIAGTPRVGFLGLCVFTGHHRLRGFVRYKKNPRILQVCFMNYLIEKISCPVKSRIRIF